MGSTGLEQLGAAHVRSINNMEKYNETPMTRVVDDEAIPYSPGDEDFLKPSIDSTHRKLKPRHIQLIGIGGFVEAILHSPSRIGAKIYGVSRTIGTALFVQIGGYTNLR